MLLGLYLGTTALSYTVMLAFVAEILNKLKRDGYKYVTEKKSFAERLLDFLYSFLLLSFPVLNLVLALGIMSLRERIYDSIKAKGIREGRIVRLEETETIEEVETKEEVKREKKYPISEKTKQELEGMTNKEKIAYLKAKREGIFSQEEDKFNNTIEESGPVLSRKISSYRY